MKTETQETYTSRDLTMVAYLIASGFKLESYREGPAGQLLFTFSKSAQLDEHVNDFYRLTAVINPTLYSNTLRSIKTMIYASGQNQRMKKEYENEEHITSSFRA